MSVTASLEPKSRSKWWDVIAGFPHGATCWFKLRVGVKGCAVFLYPIGQYTRPFLSNGVFVREFVLFEHKSGIHVLYRG